MVQKPLLPSSAMKTPLVRKTDATGATWTLSPGSASQVAAAPDGSLWALSTEPAGSTDKYIWHYVSGAWTNVPGMANHLAVAPDGTLYVVNAGGGTYAYSGGTWTAFGGGACDITVAADGSIYVLSNAGAGADKAIWHNVKGTWSQVPGSGTFLAASWNSASYTSGQGMLGANGLYILNAQGAIYYLNTDNTYVRLSGAASAVAPVGGGLYALSFPLDASAGSPLYYYDFATNSWSAINGSGTSISANGPTLYAVGASGAIYASNVPRTIASVTLTVGTGTVPVGMPADLPLTLTVKDAGGNAITGVYPQPITLTDSDTSGATALSASTITNSAQAASLVLHYNGANLASPATISAATAGVSTASATFAPNSDAITTDGTYTYAIDGTRYSSSALHPSPSPTPFSIVATDSVSTNALGQPGLIDVHTVETYTAPASQAGEIETIDTYERWSPLGTGAQLSQMGGASSVSGASTGSDVASKWNGSPTGSALDQLPHAAGHTWQGNAYSSWSDTMTNTTVGCGTSLPADYSDSGTTNNDGSYSAVYQWTSIDGSCSMADREVVSSDGSASDTFSSTGYADTVTTIGTPKPTAGGYVIPVTQTALYSSQTPPPGATPPPTPAPTVTSVPDWYPGGGPAPSPLTSDTFTDEGTASIPAACNVPSTLATTGEEIVETYASLDPLSGIWNEQFTKYETPGIGMVCYVANISFADYSTENFGNGNPYIGTYTEAFTQGLTAVALQTAMRRAADAQAALTNAQIEFKNSITAHFRMEIGRIHRLALARARNRLRSQSP